MDHVLTLDRHKIILFHRINGYLVIVLSLIASAGAIIIAQHAFSGDMATRMWAGALVLSTTLAYVFAWINIKRLQIDQYVCLCVFGTHANCAIR